jgi:hypothetical protein
VFFFPPTRDGDASVQNLDFVPHWMRFKSQKSV